MVDQTLELGSRRRAADIRKSEIASSGHDPVRSYAFRPAPAKLALGDDAAHSITSSARSRIAGGITRPIAWAVFRLMTSRNFVGCWTGKSTGLAPFSIFAT